ncbi:hypothetical protein N6H13_30335 [Paenibacillus sp. CC-CFT742]|nr:hypothetical protein [Paenibacillus sp. CC-CFT742]WJH29127.1 hypothetical protein N6H13_30335 [Paenibacillus sp. CC-CFT742]
MDLVIYSALALIYLFLVVRIAAQLSGKRQWLNYAIFQIFVLFSLAYDNGIIAAGRFIGEGELLKGLSSVRFWLHAFATPTLVLVGYYILRSSQVKFSKHIITHIAAWVITVGLIIYQISSTLQEVKSLIPIQEYGVLRYTSESLAGPPFMVIIVGFLLLLIGIIVLVKQKWVWLFVGTLLLFVGQALPIPVASTAVTNIFELILMVSIWITTSKALDSQRR